MSIGIATLGMFSGVTQSPSGGGIPPSYAYQKEYIPTIKINKVAVESPDVKVESIDISVRLVDKSEED